MAINKEAFNILMVKGSATKVMEALKEEIETEEVKVEKKFNFSDAIDELKERLENSITKPECNDDWVKLLKELEPYQFVEIVQAVADWHLADDYTSATQMTSEYDNNNIKQLLLFSMTKNF